MTCGAWPATGAAAVNRAEEIRRRGDTAAARVRLTAPALLVLAYAAPKLRALVCLRRGTVPRDAASVTLTPTTGMAAKRHRRAWRLPGDSTPPVHLRVTRSQECGHNVPGEPDTHGRRVAA